MFEVWVGALGGADLVVKFVAFGSFWSVQAVNYHVQGFREVAQNSNEFRPIFCMAIFSILSIYSTELLIFLNLFVSRLGATLE